MEVATPVITSTERFVQTGQLSQLLNAAVSSSPDRRYALCDGHVTTIAGLQEQVSRVTVALSKLGVSNRHRVAVGLPNSIEHIAVIFALFELGALWVPLNLRLRGAPLQHVLSDCAATHLLAINEDPLSVEVAQVLGELSGAASLGDPALSEFPGVQYGSIRLWATGAQDEVMETARDVCAVIYTSGTTGPAKGVQVTESMFRASTLGAHEVIGPESGDVLYVWEPLFHIGGAQLLLLPLISEVSLAITRGFSASRFWPEVVAARATHIHYLGGILQILLKQPERPVEREHQVRVAWGAGATSEVWRACQKRFGFALHECYGMTETSSFISVNRFGPEHGVGIPMPWVDVRLSEDDEGCNREILVKGRIEGLITPGYLGNKTATRNARKDRLWWRTGDLGSLDVEGNLHFLGRSNDSFRVRGENVSAWQVESVISEHPEVELCAVVGIAAEIGEQELLLYVTANAEGTIDLAELAEWARGQLPNFQVPRYFRVLSDMPMTPSQRVAKKQLPKDLESVYDTRRSEYLKGHAL